MPILNAIISIAIVEPMPNFLPSSTVRAEAAGMAMAPPRPPTEHITSSCQKLLATGIRARKARLVRPPTITIAFLLSLSAILPPYIPSSDISKILTASSTPMRVELKPKDAAARMGRKVAKLPLPREKASRKLKIPFIMPLALISL